MTGLLLATTAQWIAATGTWFLGLVGAGFTWRQWWGNGFQPKCSAEVEVPGDAIRVRITNRERAPGVIHRVDIVDARSLSVEWAQGADFELPPTRLPGLDQMELIIQAPEGHKFAASKHRVRIDWGKGSKTVELTPVGVGLYGLTSLLPPASS
jgi:hypothetical protein